MQNYLIVIPYYNKEDRINRCIDSIYSQIGIEGFNVVTVVVDDGSKVKLTRDMITNQNTGIHIINKKNGGCGQARLSGIEYAVEKLGLDDDYNVITIDPDDSVMNTMLLQVDNAFRRFKDVDIIEGTAFMYYNGTYYPYYIAPYLAGRTCHGKTYPFEGVALNKVYEINLLDVTGRGHSVIFKYCKLGLWKKCLHKCNLRINMGEDLFLTTLLCQHAKTIVYTDIDYYNYEYGQVDSIVTTNGGIPHDLRLAHLFSGFMEEMNGSTR